MLKRGLESKNIDPEMVPILKKFFLLPITPHQSCYGHIEEHKNPYLSYIDDETQNKKELEMQKKFKGKILELTERINQKIGSHIVNVSLERVEHGGGPKDYTLRFDIANKEILQDDGEKILDTIWEEFSRYLDQLR